MFFPGADVRTRVNVDGFNLNYGALKGTAFKWLNPVRLAARLLPREHAMHRLRYFPAGAGRVLSLVLPQTEYQIRPVRHFPCRDDMR